MKTAASLPRSSAPSASRSATTPPFPELSRGSIAKRMSPPYSSESAPATFSHHARPGSNPKTGRSLVDGPTQFHVRLGNTLAVSSVTLDRRPVTATFEDASHLRVNFDQAYNTNQTFTVVINYSGV